MASTVLINGPMCAVLNRALYQGGFAKIFDFATLQINAPVAVADNTVDTIVTEDVRNPSTGVVKCGDSAPWAVPASPLPFNSIYYIQGRLCDCNDQFVEATDPANGTCDRCEGV